MSGRYSKGWHSTEQDRKPQTRSAKAATQNYDEIKAQCLQEGRLWEDPSFPAIDSSVFYSQAPGTPFVWKRPTEICSDPHMFVGGASRFDIKQGDLGNCWFLAAVASLCAAGNRSESKDLINRVVPPNNSFSKDYAGVFHFRLWQYGRWIDVVIDDKLPTIDGRLMFMHSATPNEFWSALLEKAYAKLNGSYEALKGGCSSEAMEDMTGGVVETFNFTKNIPKNMWTILQKAYERRSLMACQIDAPPTQIESVLTNGLIIGHAYSVTSIKECKYAGGTAKLMRVRNPWGNQYEWKGAWCDSSPEWSTVSEQEKQRLELSKEDDGEFWMTMEDFISNFQKLEICNLSPDGLEKGPNAAVRWETTVQDGSWIPKVNAGGCRNFLDTFWTNPQYRVEVVDPDEGDDENTGTIIVALLQKERRKKKSEGIDFLTMGYSLYKIEDPNCGPLDVQFFKYNAAAGRSAFSNVREVCTRFKLPPGHYCIIPCTFKPNNEGDFLLRIYSERPAPSNEIDEETGLADEDEDDKSLEEAMQRGAVPAGGTIQSDARRRRQRAREVTQADVTDEQMVRQLFKETSGEDLEVDAFELRGILNKRFMGEFNFDGFSLETCRSMVAMMDVDKSGKLGYDEFKQMWGELRKWKKIFMEFDLDKSGTLCSYELRQALNSSGIKVSNMTFNSLVMRYSDQEGKIFFDDFIGCAFRLQTMFDTFREMREKGAKEASFPLDAFIQCTMYS